VINAYGALLAQRAGFGALYLSGAGIANACLGVPDLGLTRLEDVLTEVRRITGATPLPLLVDADTGWEDGPGVAATTRGMIDAGAAGMHLEDQVPAKRCGHRAGKVLVSKEAMRDRIQAAVEARQDPGFVIMARTDAAAVEGVDAALDRARFYAEAGADMIFAEAMHDIGEYKRFTDSVQAPVLANITEFGKTPLFGIEALREAGVAMALYPMTAYRAMARSAEIVYQTIREQGTQEPVIDRMLTRDELYERLGYHDYERRLDEMFARENDAG
jgi:methylisocitrate lyase